MKTIHQLKPILLVLLVAFAISSCVENPRIEECLDYETYGFWSGLIHGFLAPFAFILSLFDGDTAIYAFDNNGGWYNFGYLLGLACIFGGGSRAKK